MPWSMLLRIRCISGSFNWSITVLSSSVSPPSMAQLDLLMQIARQVMHQPAEAFEGPADGQHADAHRVLAQRRRQPFDLLGDRDHVRVFSAGGDLAQPGLHGDQLAHQIDKLVQLRCGHADARSIGPVFRAASELGAEAIRPRGHGSCGAGAGPRCRFDRQLAFIFDKKKYVAQSLRASPWWSEPSPSGCSIAPGRAPRSAGRRTHRP